MPTHRPTGTSLAVRANLDDAEENTLMPESFGNADVAIVQVLGAALVAYAPHGRMNASREKFLLFRAPVRVRQTAPAKR